MKTIPFEHTIIQQELKQIPVFIKKVTPTLAGCLKNEEIGTILSTYVLKANGSIKLEMEESLEESMYILRNPKALGRDASGNDIFNERYSNLSGMEYNFGKLPQSTQFEPLIKKPIIEAIQVSQQLRQALGLSTHDSATITKIGRDFEMSFAMGDFITKTGTILNKAAFDEDYRFASEAEIIDGQTQ